MHLVKYEILTPVNINISAFLNATPCSLIHWYERFEGICSSVFRIERENRAEKYDRGRGVGGAESRLFFF
jgi:hypothetical protein